MFLEGIMGLQQKSYQKIVMILIALTVVAFLLLTWVFHGVIQREFERRLRDGLAAKASEVGDILEDMDTGSAFYKKEIDDMLYSRLRHHKDFSLQLLYEIQKKEKKSKKEKQILAISLLKLYREKTGAVIGVYSPSHGMILQPQKTFGKTNIFFDDINKELVKKSMKKGSAKGTLGLIMSSGQEEVVKSVLGHFKSWEWVVFSLENADEKIPSKSLLPLSKLERLLSGPSQQIENIEVSVLDTQDKYMYEDGKLIDGRPIDKIDLRTGKPLEEMLKVYSGEFINYLKKDNIGQLYNATTYIMKTRTGRYTIFVEPKNKTLSQTLKKVKNQVNFLAVISVIALLFLIYQLYESFFVYLDPLYEQHGKAGFGRKQIANMVNAYVLFLGIVLFLVFITSLKTAQVQAKRNMSEIMKTQGLQRKHIYETYDQAGKQFSELVLEQIDREMAIDMKAISSEIGTNLQNRRSFNDIFQQMDQYGYFVKDKKNIKTFLQTEYGVENILEPIPIGGMFVHGNKMGKSWRLFVQKLENGKGYSIFARNISQEMNTIKEFCHSVERRIFHYFDRSFADIETFLIEIFTQRGISTSICGQSDEKFSLNEIQKKQLVFQVLKHEKDIFSYRGRENDKMNEYLVFSTKIFDRGRHLVLRFRIKTLDDFLNTPVKAILQFISIMGILGASWTIFRFFRIFFRG